eukprot:TRINITY_DN5812_c0_g1_i1.p1 TRINITY_DN5812_c0_g1~~TRINITY_DN5812_c0_g1_i1.p1  ORF type:complete len:1246 (-),score=191.21 TRINITY_DN5812_c0_g1_i1:54-3791(-)
MTSTKESGPSLDNISAPWPTSKHTDKRKSDGRRAKVLLAKKDKEKYNKSEVFARPNQSDPKVLTKCRRFTVPERVDCRDSMLRGRVFHRKNKDWKPYLLELEDISHSAELKDLNYPESGKCKLISITGCKISVQALKSGVNFSIHESETKKTYDFRVYKISDMNQWLMQIHNCQQFLLRREIYGAISVFDSTSSQDTLGPDYYKLGPDICPFLQCQFESQETQDTELIKPTVLKDIAGHLLQTNLSSTSMIDDYLVLLHHVELRHGAKIIKANETFGNPSQEYALELIASLETSLNWQGQSKVQEYFSNISEGTFSQKVTKYMNGLGNSSLLVRLTNACAPNIASPFWTYIQNTLLAKFPSQELSHLFKVFVVFHSDEIWVVHSKKMEDMESDLPKYAFTWEVKLVFDYNIDLISWDGCVCSFQCSQSFSRSSRLNLQKILTQWARCRPFCSPTQPDEIFKSNTEIPCLEMSEKEVFTGTPEEVLYRSLLISHPSSPSSLTGSTSPSSASPHLVASPSDSPYITPGASPSIPRKYSTPISMPSYDSSQLTAESGANFSYSSDSVPRTTSTSFSTPPSPILSPSPSQDYSNSKGFVTPSATGLKVSTSLYNLLPRSYRISNSFEGISAIPEVDASGSQRSPRSTESPKDENNFQYGADNVNTNPASISACLGMSSAHLSMGNLTKQLSGDLFCTGLQVPLFRLKLGKIEIFNKKGQKVLLQDIIGERLCVVVLLRNFGCMYPSIQSQELLARTELQLMDLGANLIIIGRGSKEIHQQWLAACSNRSLDDITYRTSMNFDCVLNNFGVPKKKSHCMTTLYAQAVFEPEKGLLYYFRPNETLLDLSFTKICKTLEEFGRTHDLEVWRKNGPRVTHNACGQVILSTKKFWVEEPKNILHDDVVIKGEQPFTIDDTYEHYCAFLGRDVPMVVSVSTELALNGTRKAVLWLPQDVKRVFVPREAAATIQDSLKHAAHLPQGSFTSRVTSVDFMQRNIGEDLNELSSKLHENSFKFGVVFMQNGKSTADQMYKNNSMSPAFEDFLNIIATKICLNGWSGFSGGLDTRENFDGQFSYYTDFHSEKIMFHVSPMIPFISKEPSRKRFIGNDIVVIIFKDEGCTEDLNPKSFQSHFNHIFILVSKLTKDDLIRYEPQISGEVDTDWYHIDVFCKTGLRVFHPRLPNPQIIKKENLREWLLTKCINGERTAIEEVAAFSNRMLMVRQKILGEILMKHATSQPLSNKTRKRRLSVHL